jgi:hypothetical protein
VFSIKHIATVVLVIAVLCSGLGNCISALQKAYHYSLRFQQQKHLLQLQITEAQIANGEIVFTEKDEIKIDGKFYDVIDTKIINNKKVITVLQDDTDEALHKFAKQQQQDKKQQQTQATFLLFCAALQQFRFIGLHQFIKTDYALYQSTELLVNIKLDNPPPQSVV